MGSPKHALRLPDGRTMIEHVRDALASVCSRIITLGGTPVIPGIQHIPDSTSGLGPIGGLGALLANEPANDSLVVPCDMPLLTEQVLQTLLRATSRPISAFRIGGEDWIRSLPLRISPSILPAIRARCERGRLSLHGLLDEVGVEIVEAPREWEPLLANINTPEEFASLRRSIEARHPIG